MNSVFIVVGGAATGCILTLVLKCQRSPATHIAKLLKPSHSPKLVKERVCLRTDEKECTTYNMV